MSLAKEDKGVSSDSCGCSCNKCKLGKCVLDDHKCVCGGEL